MAIKAEESAGGRRLLGRPLLSRAQRLLRWQGRTPRGRGHPALTPQAECHDDGK
jgi:hypothetical protein